MSDSNPPTKPATLRSRILSYIVYNGEGTAEGIARTFKLSPEEVDRVIQTLAADHEIYRIDSDPEGVSYGLSIRWKGRYVIPGEYIEAGRPLPDITMISFRSLPTGDPADDRPAGTVIGHMIEVAGVLHPRIFADPEVAVVTGIALRHIDRQEADWASSVFFRILGRVGSSFPAERD